MDLVASSLYGAWIVSPASLAAANAMYAYDPTSDYYAAGIDGGTGPYTIKSYTPDSEVLLVGLPRLLGWLDGHQALRPGARLDHARGHQPAAGARRRRCRHRLQRAPREPRQLHQQPRLHRRRTSPRSSTTWACSTPARRPSTTPRSAQALSYAIPYDDIIKVGAQGYGTQSHGPVPAGVFPYDEQRPPVHQDIEKAKALLSRGRSRGWRLLDGDHLRLREPGRGAVRAAAPGRLQPAGHQRHAHPDAVQPAVGARQGRRRRSARTCSCCSTGRPTPTPARTTCGRCSTAAMRPSSTSPTGTTRSTTGSSMTPATKTATDRAAAQAGYTEAMNIPRRPGARRLPLRHPSSFPLSNQDRGLPVQPELPLRPVLLPAPPSAVTA